MISSFNCQYIVRVFICLALLLVASHSVSASVLSFVKNNVYRLEYTNKVSVSLNDKVSNTQVGTGEKSMCELLFDDRSLTRLGENSLLSFAEQERLIKCGDGKFLVSKDPDTQPITVTAGGVTAAINGSTVLFDVKNGIAHVAVIETTSGVKVTYSNGKTLTLQSGEGVCAAPRGMAADKPLPVDVKEMISTSPLFVESGLAPLANDALIKGVVSAQEAAKTTGVSFSSEINEVALGRINCISDVSQVNDLKAPEVDTAAGGNAAPDTQAPIPPVSMNPYPAPATPY